MQKCFELFIMELMSGHKMQTEHSCVYVFVRDGTRCGNVLNND